MLFRILLDSFTDEQLQRYNAYIASKFKKSAMSKVLVIILASLTSPLLIAPIALSSLPFNILDPASLTFIILLTPLPPHLAPLPPLPTPLPTPFPSSFLLDFLIIYPLSFSSTHANSSFE